MNMNPNQIPPSPQPNQNNNGNGGNKNSNDNSNSGSKKNLIISGAVIVVVLAALFVFPKLNNKTAEAPTDENVKVETEAVSSGVPLSRADALVKYAGKVIKFSGQCVADPVSMEQSQGTTIMIDNDTSTKRTIVVGAKSYSISPQHYTLSWLNTGAGELKVLCDGKEVSKVKVQ
jgi:hypothetical protein